MLIKICRPSPNARHCWRLDEGPPDKSVPEEKKKRRKGGGRKYRDSRRGEKRNVLAETEQIRVEEGETIIWFDLYTPVDLACTQTHTPSAFMQFSSHSCIPIHPIYTPPKMQLLSTHTNQYTRAGAESSCTLNQSGGQIRRMMNGVIEGGGVMLHCSTLGAGEKKKKKKSGERVISL